MVFYAYCILLNGGKIRDLYSCAAFLHCKNTVTFAAKVLSCEMVQNLNNYPVTYPNIIH